MRIVFALALMLVMSPVVAQEADPTAATRGLMPFILAGMIAYVTRRMAIGGWLFYFYLGLCLSVVITTFMAVSSLPNLNPEGWDMFYWWMAVLDYIPLLMATAASFIFGVRLLFRSQRNSGNLRIMRFALLAVVIFNVTSIFIGGRFFPEDESGNVLSAFGAVFSSIWCVYWFVSRRVKYVMTLGDHEWNYEDFKSGGAPEAG